MPDVHAAEPYGFAVVRSCRPFARTQWGFVGHIAIIDNLEEAFIIPLPVRRFYMTAPPSLSALPLCSKRVLGHHRFCVDGRQLFGDLFGCKPLVERLCAV